MRFADLHTHTIHSDGTRTPVELIELASSFDIELVAITDHDTIAALDHARPIADELGITLIAGVELSVSWRGHDVHLLGYAFDTSDQRLLKTLAEFREVRDTRGAAMVERLNEIGVDIDLEDVRQLCGDASFGRPHIARILVENGECSSVDDAFDRYLIPGRPGFLPKRRFAAADAIEMIHDAGGVVSLAHPIFYSEPIVLIEELISLGLDGVETRHPKITPEWSRKFEEVCHLRGLMATGGSDDHGFEARQTFGQIRVPETSIRPILDRVTPVA